MKRPRRLGADREQEDLDANTMMLKEREESRKSPRHLMAIAVTNLKFKSDERTTQSNNDHSQRKAQNRLLTRRHTCMHHHEHPAGSRSCVIDYCENVPRTE